MTATSPRAFRPASGLATDLMMAAFLIGLVAAARLLPHPPNVTPAMAAALFAGATLSRRWVAFAVPIAAMLVSDAIIGRDHWAIALTVYAALALPAAIGMVARRYRLSRMFLPAVISGSLVFFVTSNFAVWLFSGMYSLDAAGLAACYVAALPFLQYSLAGDLLWSAVLFGGGVLLMRLNLRPHRDDVLARP